MKEMNKIEEQELINVAGGNVIYIDCPPDPGDGTRFVS